MGKSRIKEGRKKEERRGNVKERQKAVIYLSSGTSPCYVI
jgi:hypothetical protein